MDGARDALIVAVAEYSDPKLQRLRAPSADAEALARVLADESIAGFDVQLALDEDESTLSRRLARFFANRRPHDLLLVHFSCHGVKDASGELYMAAADTETDLLSATGIPSRWLNEQISQCRSKRIVVLLDCCFSGSFPFGMQVRAGEQVNVQEHLIGRGRVVITASNAMEYSFEGDELSGAGQPSIFTAAVVEGLETGEADRDGDRRVSVDELYDYVYDRVRETTPNQSPTKLSSLEGPLYIARSRYERPVEPAPLPQELVELTRHPYAEARIGAIAELSKLLVSGNRGVELSARMALEELTGDDSRRVSMRAREALGESAGALGASAGAQEPAADAAAHVAEPEPEPAVAHVAEPEPELEPAAAHVAEPEPEPAVAEPQPAAAFVVPEPAPGPVSRVTTSSPRTRGRRRTPVRPKMPKADERLRIAQLAAVAMAVVVVGSIIGTLLSNPVLKHTTPASGTAVAGFALGALPITIALAAVAFVTRAGARTPVISVIAVILGAAIAAVGGGIHFNPSHPHVFFALAYALVGVGVAIAATLPSRDQRVVPIALAACVVAGLIAGRIRPLKYPGIDGVGPLIVANLVAATITTLPACTMIGWLSLRRRGARAEPAVPGAATAEL